MTNYFTPPNGDGTPIPFTGFYPDLCKRISDYGKLDAKTRLEIEAWLEYIIETEYPEYYEIYDFAMNLVKRVVDNESFDTGFYPSAGYGRRTWDGLNGEGEKVAVGMYYFKVELSTGEVRWGKLAVIP